ncbi:crotonase/enoyl-CoA hydratase family protein [Corynebacterium suicordis]|uniref:Crotonase/enoyl-CoA hydratase family protein n=1 Tax=Corynebacterium suicordis DSM 45110 TaxID=1121369 RepID=A0ABR9ZGY0_9CORY|nr:crotonase/enoyl-CoA hydratase family protein [Corynebacterium suicordis]MBF4552649.1 crotonase/enoyl-CoA hydratase family protein [Corynebacterium suicordis DSM 45110]MDR6278392.1 enoyl-CoA hydratase/carnithine racemase [Corynebacterium suicordis]
MNNKAGNLTFTRGTGDLANVVYLKLDRPDKLNGLTLDMLRALVSQSKQISGDRSIRAVIIHGEGQNFSAGLDFGTVMKNPMDIAKAFAPRPWRGTNLFQEGPWCLRRLPVPVIAAVEGYCFGGGVQIAMAADYRFATPDSQWSVLEAKWGLIPDMSGIQSLSQVLPIDVAKRLAMTGEQLDGTRAAELGLVSEVSADPLAAAEDLARLIVSRSPDSVSYAKRLFDETWNKGPRATFFKERLRQARLLGAKNTKIAQKAAAKAKGVGEAVKYNKRGV